MNIDPSMSELFPGDTLQLDGGLWMVEVVGAKTADCLPVGKPGKPREVNNPFPKAQIVKRGGQAALDKLNGLRVVKRGFVRLEAGDRLCVKGKVGTVVEVKSEKVVLIGSLDGDEWSEDRVVNEFLMTDCITSVVTRLDGGQRSENLKQFLAQRKQPPQREVVGISGDKPTEETETENMSKKTKVKKVKAARKSKASSGEIKPRSERKEFIWAQLDGSVTKRDIATAVVEKFGGDFDVELKRVNDAPFYMRKAGGLNPEWKKEESKAAE